MDVVLAGVGMPKEISSHSFNFNENILKNHSVGDLVGRDGKERSIN